MQWQNALEKLLVASVLKRGCDQVLIFLMFLEFYFSFFSYEVAGPWGFTTSRSTLSLNQLKPTDILIILNLVVCRGVIHDCCVTQLSSTGLLTNH